MGTWARLTAVAAVAGTGLAVVSGAAGWGTAHRVLAAVALPPLAALAAIAWVTARRLLPLGAGGARALRARGAADGTRRAPRVRGARVRRDRARSPRDVPRLDGDRGRCATT